MSMEKEEPIEIIYFLTIFLISQIIEWFNFHSIGQTFLNGKILRIKVVFPSSGIVPGTLKILNKYLNK